MAFGGFILEDMNIGIDVGATKVLVCHITEKGIKKSIRFETPKLYTDFLALLSDTVASLTTDSIDYCVVAIPGVIDQEKGYLISCGNLDWSDIPIKNDLQLLLHCNDLYIENDAKLAAISEARQIPAFRRIFYLTVSTGIGGALVIDGKLDQSTIHNEIGHTLYERDGKIVTWQSFASGKALVQRFGKRASEIDDPHIWTIFSSDLSLGIVDIAAFLYPDVIIIGGGVGTHFNKYKDQLNSKLQALSSPVIKVPQIRQAVHPEEAVIYGCIEIMKDYEKSS